MHYEIGGVQIHEVYGKLLIKLIFVCKKPN